MPRSTLPPTPWTRLPQQPTPVRADLPKPTALFLGSVGLVDPVNGDRFSQTGSVAFGAGPGGKSAIFQTGNGNRIILGTNPDLIFPDTSNATIVLYRRKFDTTARTTFNAGYAPGANDRVLAALPYSTTGAVFDFGNATAGSGRLVVTGLTYTTQPECWVLVASATRGREIWRNGKLVGSDTGATASRPSNTTAGVHVGAVSAALPSEFEENYLTVFYPDDLKQAHCAQISAQPWAIFQPLAKPFYFNAVSSGTTNGVASGVAVATGAVVGASLFSAPASGIAVGTGALVGASLFSAPSSGVAVATGLAVGASLFSAVAAGTAVATGAAVGEGSATDDGVAAGIAVATGAAVGASLFSAPAAGIAVATGLAVGASLFSAVAAGTAVATGIVIATSAPAVNRTQGSERYAPNPIPRDLESLIRYVDTELNVIKGFINRLADGHIDMTYVAPVRPRTGDYRLADGTEWNPGSGYGMYVYDGSTWQRLVDVTLAATETQAGIIEIATQAEANTGTDDARAITPLKLKTIITEQTWDG